MSMHMGSVIPTREQVLKRFKEITDKSIFQEWGITRNGDML